MTRPKVDPDKRQRTAQACDACKRRKQKCDGQTPCSTCQKRSAECTYYTSDQDPHYNSSPGDQSAPKRVRENTSRDDASASADTPMSSHHTDHGLNTPVESNSNPSDAPKFSSFFPQMRSKDTNQGNASSSQNAAPDDQEEEAENHTMTRMLEDSNGRLLYVGDASNISFLQLLRMIVETAAGPCPFSLNPMRHRLVENELNTSLKDRTTYQLPDKKTALVLVRSFFTNSHGLLQIFDEDGFLGEVEKCYASPLSVDRNWLCLFFLVIAIGLSLATPLPGNEEAEMINELKLKEIDESEVFFFNAKNLNDPMTGLEDSDFWSIQALTLMGVYLLTRAARNKAYVYIGMAIRSGYALGLHREETLSIFSAETQAARRSIWRSLFILDRFLAASLGRPIAITEDESLGDVLDASTPSAIGQVGTAILSGKQICSAGMAAAVRSGHVVGIILKKVYRERTISTTVAQELADECIQWPQSLSPALHWRQASPENVRQAIAILHVNLVYCHSIILLTRPFFLYLLSAEIQRTRLHSTDRVKDEAHERKQRSTRLRKFSNACLVASNHTVALVQKAYEAKYLPQQNPFATYTLFAAALVIFAHEFGWPKGNALSVQCMSNSISILEYSGQRDPSARRNAVILREFHDVLSREHPDGTMANTIPDDLFDSLSSAPGQQQQQQQQQQNNGQAPDSALQSLPGVTSADDNSNPPAFVNPDVSGTFAFSPPAMPMSENPFSGLLDLENTVLPVPGEGNPSSDEGIDFDSLWHWPFNDPLPTPGGEGGSTGFPFES